MLSKRAKLSNEQTFELGEYTITAWGYDSPYSWGHYAKLYKGDSQIDEAKYTYYNRTWETYKYQSIVHGILGKNKLSGLSKLADQLGETGVREELKKLSGLVRMGQLMGVDGAKVLEIATNGQVNRPEEWETLPEEEREKRLSRVINLLEE